MTGLLCDFCVHRDVPVVWRYPAQTFVVAEPTGATPGLKSEGDWLTCDPCHALIEAADWEQLAHRSACSYAAKYGTPVAAILPIIVEMHQGFRAHRGGAPAPYAEATQ